MKIVELDHPLVQHKLGHLRDAALDPVRFRQFAGEIGMIKPRIGKIRAAEIRIATLRMQEVGAGQVGPPEIGTTQPRET